MHYLLLIFFLMNSFSLSAKEIKEKKVRKARYAVATKTKKTTPPCDKKEDILKKLAEKEKTSSKDQKIKGFTLQGGDSGCQVK